MIVECATCHAYYDDNHRSVGCPHEPLFGAMETPLLAEQGPFGFPHWIGDEDHPLTTWPTYAGIARNTSAGHLSEHKPLTMETLGIAIKEFPWMPKDQIWLVSAKDGMPVIRAIVNIGNALQEADALSLCVGEMK